MPKNTKTRDREKKSPYMRPSNPSGPSRPSRPSGPSGPSSPSRPSRPSRPVHGGSPESDFTSSSLSYYQNEEINNAFKKDGSPSFSSPEIKELWSFGDGKSPQFPSSESRNNSPPSLGGFQPNNPGRQIPGRRLGPGLQIPGLRTENPPVPGPGPGPYSPPLPLSDTDVGIPFLRHTAGFGNFENPPVPGPDPGPDPPPLPPYHTDVENPFLRHTAGLGNFENSSFPEIPPPSQNTETDENLEEGIKGMTLDDSRSENEFKYEHPYSWWNVIRFL